LQNRERTGVTTRAARVGWWMRPDEIIDLEALKTVAVDVGEQAAGIDFYKIEAPARP